MVIIFDRKKEGAVDDNTEQGAPHLQSWGKRNDGYDLAKEVALHKNDGKGWMTEEVGVEEEREGEGEGEEVTTNTTVHVRGKRRQ